MATTVWTGGGATVTLDERGKLRVDGTSEFARSLRRDARHAAGGVPQPISVLAQPSDPFEADLTNRWCVDAWVRQRSWPAGVTIESDYEPDEAEAPKAIQDALKASRALSPREPDAVY